MHLVCNTNLTLSCDIVVIEAALLNRVKDLRHFSKVDIDLFYRDGGTVSSPLANVFLQAKAWFHNLGSGIHMSGRSEELVRLTWNILWFSVQYV